MLIDSRDYIAEDGWPIIAARDRLPLLQLLEGAHLTDGIVKSIKACDSRREGIRRAYELEQSRDAVCYELTLPAWWHCCPVRKIVCSHSKPKGDRP